MQSYMKRTTFLVREYGVVEVFTYHPPNVEVMLGRGNWAAWYSYVKVLEVLGQRADARLA